MIPFDDCDCSDEEQKKEKVFILIICCGNVLILVDPCAQYY